MSESLDVAIVGGGILGLLALRELRLRDVSAYLFEQDELGGDQTLHSQAFLIRGHLYALYNRPAPTFETSVEGWNALLEEQGGVAQGPTYYAIEQANERSARKAWSGAGLSFRAPSSLPAGFDSSGVKLFDSLERYLPDAATFVERLIDRADLKPWIRRGRVTDIDAMTGEIDVENDGATQRLAARAVAIASGRARFCGLEPNQIHGGSMIGALVIKGPDVPRYALVAPIASLNDRGPIRWMCVPRYCASTGERAWLCSALLPENALNWQRLTADGLKARCTTLDWSTMTLGSFTETFWPGFDAPGGYQVQTKGCVVAAWPARLTLAPAASRAVAGAVEAILSENHGSPSPPPRATTLPPVAAERWQEISTTAYAALP